MIAEINNWSVTFYASVDSDDRLLCRLALFARENSIRFGSVSVLAVMLPTIPGETPTPPYIWFPYFDEKDACILLSKVGINLESVTFI